MNLVSGVAVAFLAVYLLVGLYAARNLQGTSDFYVMGRRASGLLITGTLLATNVSSVTFVGFAGGAFGSGPLLYVAFFGMTSAASLFVGLYLGRYLWRMGLWTVPDYFAARFPGQAIRSVAAVVVLLSMVLYLISIMQGVGVAAGQLLGWSPPVAIVVILTIITAFTFLGGMRGVVLTDTIMIIVIYVAALGMAPFIISAAGGWPGAVEAAAAELPRFTAWNGTRSTWDAAWFLIETNVLSLILVVASPQLLSRVYIARDERALARAMVYQALLLPIFIFGLLYVFGLAPLAAGDVDPVDAFPYVATNLVPAVVGAIALSGVVAAAMSTASALFQQGAAALSRDLYQRLVNPAVSERSFLLLSRLCVLGLALVVGVGAVSTDVTSATIVYGFLLASAAWAAWLPALVAGILWRRTSAAAAVWSIVAGLGCAVVVGIGRNVGFTPAWLPPNVVGLSVAAVVLCSGSLLTQPTAAGLAVFDAMRRPVDRTASPDEEAFT